MRLRAPFRELTSVGRRLVQSPDVDGLYRNSCLPVALRVWLAAGVTCLLASLLISAPASAQLGQDSVGFVGGYDFEHSIGTGGWIPDGSPLQLKFDTGVREAVTAELNGLAYLWSPGPSAYELSLAGGDGTFSIDGGIWFILLGRTNLPWPIGQWEFEIPFIDVPHIDVTWQDSEQFTPFLLTGDPERPVELWATFAQVHLFDVDITDLILPIPYVEGGVSVSAEAAMTATLQGEEVLIDGSTSVDAEAERVPVSEKSHYIAEYHEQFTRGANFGVIPAFYVQLGPYRWDVDFPIDPIAIPLDLGVPLDLPFNSEVLSFDFPDDPLPQPTALIVSASASPSSGVDPYSSVQVSGEVRYNVDRDGDGDNDLIPVGTVTLDTGYNEYTAPISQGTFSRTVQVGGSDTTIQVEAGSQKPDGTGPVTGNTGVFIDVLGPGSANVYDYDRSTVCLDTSAEGWPISETTFIRSDHEQLYVWFRITDVFRYVHNGECVMYRQDWYLPGDPAGDPTWSFEWDPEWWLCDPGMGYYADAIRWVGPLPVAGTGNADIEGTWTVEIYIDDGEGWELQDSVNFTMRYDLTEHRTCKGISSEFEPLNPTDIFTQTDSRVYTWMSLDNLAEDLDVKWQWYEPNGSLYTEFTAEPISDYDESPGGFNPPFDWYYIWGWTGIAGRPAASKCGKWEIRVSIRDPFGNYDHEYTDYFQIVESPNVDPNVTVDPYPASPVEGQGIRLDVDASDNTYLDTVTLHWNDGSWHSQTFSSDINASSFSGSRQIGSYSTGTVIECYAVATDTSGNSATSAYGRIIVGDSDSTGPAIENVLILESAGDGDSVTEDDENTLISWTLSDPSGIGSVSLTVDGVPLTVEGSYYGMSALLQPGWHPYQIEAEDADDTPSATSLVGSFHVADDDTAGPIFSAFSPSVAQAEQPFTIACTIEDQSGVYDDGTGSEGQGVCLIWDNDGELDQDRAGEIQMSPEAGSSFSTDSAIPGQAADAAVVYVVTAYDNDADGGRANDRTQSASDMMPVVIEAPDTTPPSPDPMAWETPPQATSATVIAMTAAAATDASTPVEYYFECVSGGGSSRDWLADRTHTDTGLSVNTEYGYQVQARDSSPAQNATGWSTPVAYAYTLAEIPPAPTVVNPTTTTLDVDPNPGGNPSSTQFAIYNETSSEYIAADGSGNGSTPIWRTDAQWGTTTVTGLSSSTTYTFRVMARNGDDIPTALGPPASGTTSDCQAPAGPLNFRSSSVGSDYVWWAWDDASDDEDGFRIDPVGITASANSESLLDAGLLPNTEYTRHVHAYNACGDSAPSNPASTYTYPKAPSVDCDKSTGVTYPVGTQFAFTNLAGWGSGNLDHYHWVWDNSPTHSWTGSEPTWSSGTLGCTGDSEGSWYLHVMSHNLDHASGGTQDYEPYVVGQKAVIRVRLDGSDANDGLSWPAAKQTVQAGLDACNPGDEVWVAAGTHVQPTINMPGGVALYGGFDGTETEREQRDWRVNVAVLDADYTGPVVVVETGAPVSTRIDGFTIRRGVADGAVGGGINCWAASATIVNNVITENTAPNGGGLSFAGYAPVVANNVIAGNEAVDAGGGVYCNLTSAIISSNTITGNYAAYGSGIHTDYGDAMILGNTITGNLTGGGYSRRGGISCSSRATVANNIVAYNESGIDADSGASLQNNCVYGNTDYDYHPDMAPPGPGDISVDPQFVDYEGGNLHLLPTSPCIDAGEDSFFDPGDVDMDGQPRIYGPHVDIGADERLTPAAPRVLLEVHPNERAPGASDPQFLGWDPWTQPPSSPHDSYWWKKYEFYANGPIWIQVCAQNMAGWQHAGYGDDDNTWLEVNGIKPADYDGIQSGPPAGWQWVGSKENGQRWTLRFLHVGAPGKQSLWLGADESPVLWWIKVTDLDPGVIEAIE